MLPPPTGSSLHSSSLNSLASIQSRSSHSSSSSHTAASFLYSNKVRILIQLTDRPTDRSTDRPPTMSVVGPQSIDIRLPPKERSEYHTVYFPWELKGGDYVRRLFIYLLEGLRDGYRLMVNKNDCPRVVVSMEKRGRCSFRYERVFSPFAASRTSHHATRRKRLLFLFFPLLFLHLLVATCRTRFLAAAATAAGSIPRSVTGSRAKLGNAAGSSGGNSAI